MALQTGQSKENSLHIYLLTDDLACAGVEIGVIEVEVVEQEGGHPGAVSLVAGYLVQEPLRRHPEAVGRELSLPQRFPQPRHLCAVA